MSSPRAVPRRVDVTVLPRAILLLLLMTLPTVLQPPAAESQGAGMQEITGAWEGVYHVYPQIMRLSLQLRPAAGGGIEGEASFAPLDGGNGGIMQAGSGRFAVSGSYDAGSGAFDLAPTAWLEQPTSGGGGGLTLIGVHDPRTDALAGTLPGSAASASPYFALARPNQAEAMLIRPARAAASARVVNVPAAPRTGNAIVDLLGGGIRRAIARGPDRESILAWAGRLRSEYPEMDPYNTEMGALFLRARSLFEDEHFRAHFGQTYDELSDAERTAIWVAMRPTMPGRGQRPDEELIQYSGLAGAFSATGTYSVADITVSVLAQRILRSWRAETMTGLAGLPANADAFEVIRSIEAAAAERLATLWPSEQEAFGAEIASTRSRLAVPVLAARIEEALATPSTYEGALVLAAWPIENAELLEWSPAARDEQLARVEARLDAVLESLMAEEVLALDRLGTGVDAVVAGGEWLRDLATRYSFASNRPPVQSAVHRLQGRRDGDLQAARDAIASRLASESSLSGVEGVLASYLSVPGDRQTAAGTELLALAGDRRRAIERTAYLARFSAEEQRFMTADGGVDYPAGWHNEHFPGPEEVRLAMMRAFTDAGGRWIDENTVTYGWAFLMGQFDWHIDILDVNIGTGCFVRTTGCGLDFEPMGNEGVLLDIEARWSVQMSPEMEGFFREFDGLGGGTFLEGAMNAMIALDGPAAMTHQFVATPDGWKSPTLTRDVSLQNLSFMRDAMVGQ